MKRLIPSSQPSPCRQGEGDQGEFSDENIID